MHRIGFDSDQYGEMQSRHIAQRRGEFGGKLYLEFGGKLIDDMHASRVLPGFTPDNKVRMLRELAGRGSAVFFSSHVLEVVEKLCNKVAIIKQGTLRACGPTAEVVGDESLEDVFLDMIDRAAPSSVTDAVGAR